MRTSLYSLIPNRYFCLSSLLFKIKKKTYRGQLFASMVIDHCMQPMWYWTGLLKKEAKTTGHRQILSHNSFKRQQRNPKKHQDNKNRRTPTREDKMQPKKPFISNANLIERNCTWARISIQTLFFIKNAQWCTQHTCGFVTLSQSHVFYQIRRIILIFCPLNELINRRPRSDFKRHIHSYTNRNAIKWMAIDQLFQIS